MADNATLALWEKLKSMIDTEIDSRTRSCCRLKSMVVSVAYNPSTKTVGVKEPFGETIQIPVCSNIQTDMLLAGKSVWVMLPYSSMSNAIVLMMGDGTTSASTDGQFEIVSMSDSDFNNLSVAEKAALYAGGVRAVFTGTFLYILTSAGGYNTVSDPNALPANGTAVNSALLGGKAPAYYLPVRELLDNCAFDIAQAGIDGKHGNYQYVADRWIAETPTNSKIVSEKNGDTITISNTGTAATSILQRTTVEWLDQFVGQAATMAVCLADGTIHCQAGTVPEMPTSSSKNTCVIYLSGVTISLTRFTTQQQLVRMTIQPGSSISVKWIRLVLGEYTAETLPPYIPRSYEAELAACQRYFVQYESNHDYSDIAVGLSNADAGGTYFPIHFPVPMRTAPSIWYNNISLFKIYTPMVSPSNLTVYSSESSESGCKHQLLRANTSGLGLTASNAYMLNMTTGAILQFIADP